MSRLVNGDFPMLEGSDRNLEQNNGVYQPDYVSSVSNIETGKKVSLRKAQVSQIQIVLMSLLNLRRKSCRYVGGDT